MEFFIDTGDIEEIKEANTWGVVDGVTTNPSLVAQTGKSQVELINEIVNIVDGPISAEVIATNSEGMIKEGAELAKIHPNVVVKIPMTIDGMKACKWFTENNIKTNVTLVFSCNQALLAAKNGATYVSPFVGRVDDMGQKGMQIIDEIRTIFDNYGFETKILTASVRHTDHAKDAAMIGSDVATMPFKVIKQMFGHPLTDIGLAKFMADHAKANKL
jgi:transaldolase